MAVGAPFEDSNATGVNPSNLGQVTAGDPLDSGAVYFYQRTGSTWILRDTFKASNPGTGDEFGTSVALTANGQVLAVGAPSERSADTSQSNNSGTDVGAVYTFARQPSVWTQRSYLKASNRRNSAFFGFSVSLSASGFLAVGAPGTFTTQTGEVYVFQGSASFFERDRFTADDASERDLFGDDVAISRDGNFLVVSAKFEDGSATGVDGSVDDVNSGAGAAYVFRRSVSTWTQQNYLKSPNNVAGQGFGQSVAVSGAGEEVVVGSGDNGSGTGVNPIFNSSASGSGAAFLY